MQFYEHEAALIDQLAAYVGSALVTGDGAIVIGTDRRRIDVRARLAQRGLDIDVPIREGRYVPLDAATTLQQTLSPAGWPDAARFHAVVSSAVDRVRRAVGMVRPRIAAFGEMVALLCAAGDFAAAVRFEELWNELAAAQSFSLFCAYPMSLFKTDADAAARFMRICAQHSHVFSADRRNGLTRPRP